jgi:hypothetical protein
VRLDKGVGEGEGGIRLELEGTQTIKVNVNDFWGISVKRAFNSGYEIDCGEAKLLVRPLATAALLARIQTALKNHKWAT